MNRTICSAALRKSCSVLALGILASCAPTNHRVILRELNSVFARMPHQCVPLGWNPIPVETGMYYSGESVELRQESVWLPALWIGRIRTSELRDPEVRVSYNVLNELARIHMLERLSKPSSYEYHLTLQSLPYYYEESHFRNNPDGLPYLCYSTIAPQNVLWNQPIHVENTADGPLQVFRAGFTWSQTENAEWADNPFLRAHSITLAPTRSPTVAKFAYIDGNWVIATIYAQEIPLPRVANASVWPSEQTR